jgi:tRNA A37 threonylcarbamoyladenosine dehydratase
VNETDLRFGGIARLYGVDGLERLRRAHVGIVGVGGVGSWTVEALARSGIGRLTLVDPDDVCVSNVNRQIHSLDETVGRPKVEALEERVRGINPHCHVEARFESFSEASADRLVAGGFTFVVDAIDVASDKCLLLACCRDRRVPVVSCGGAGGRRDPTAVKVADLSVTGHDRLLHRVREQLRKMHEFPRGKVRFGIDCVYSPEPLVFAQPDGSVCATRAAATTGEDLRLNCESGLGTATFVTGTFGLVAAARVVERIAGANLEAPEARRAIG